jgi:hypothetical protein
VTLVVNGRGLEYDHDGTFIHLQGRRARAAVESPGGRQRAHPGFSAS